MTTPQCIKLIFSVSDTKVWLPKWNDYSNKIVCKVLLEQQRDTSPRNDSGPMSSECHHTCCSCSACSSWSALCVCLCCAGSSGSVRSQPDQNSQQLTVPTDLFRPISPHSHSDSEGIPRLPAPRRAHTFSRTLRRQVTKRQRSETFLSVSSGL